MNSTQGDSVPGGSREKEEKLVQEIARLFCICCGELNWDSGLCERIDPPTGRLCDLIKRIVQSDVMPRILKAVADGMPLLGEKDRIKFWGGAELNLARGDIIITLSPTGAGKEEEK